MKAIPYWDSEMIEKRVLWAALLLILAFCATGNKMNTRSLKTECFVHATEAELSMWSSILTLGFGPSMELVPMKNWDRILLWGKGWEKLFEYQGNEILQEGDAIRRVDGCSVREFVQFSPAGDSTVQWAPLFEQEKISKLGLLLVGSPERIRSHISEVEVIREEKVIVLQIGPAKH